MKSNQPVRLEIEDLLKFNFCPFCGDSAYIYYGDYSGYVYCLNDCDDLEFEFIAEIKHRFPDRFRKWIDNL